MNAMPLLQLVFNILIIIPLYYASKEDLKYNRIDKKYVIMIFLIVMAYTMLSTEYAVERTFSFLITLGIFSAMTFFSRGAFGFGDTLILGALGWYIGSLIFLRDFYMILVFTMLVWGAYQIIKNRKNISGLKQHLKTIHVLPIDKVLPGMILASDYFMTGLTEKDIMELKKDGYVSLDIKLAYPFIPVIFIAFLIHIVFHLYF